MITNLSWKIKGKVYNVRPIKQFKNGRGKFFSFMMKDQSDEIKIICFNSQCQYFDVISDNQVHLLKYKFYKLYNSILLVN